MKIDTYILAHQEEKIIGYTMKHYTQFSKVIVYEGHSTDRTVEIAESYGAEIRKVDTNNESNELIFLEIKNNCWKGSKADWVIIADCDEFVYCPNLIEVLENAGDYTVFLPRLLNMFSEVFPTTEGQIYEEVKMGREGGSKMNLFRPDQVEEINFDVGCHVARPKGNIKLCLTSPIMTLHMRNLSLDYLIAKCAYISRRLSKVNIDNKWGYHVSFPPSKIRQDFRNECTALLPILP